MKRSSQFTGGIPGQARNISRSTHLPFVGGDEHSWHIDCEKCHLVAVAADAGDARVEPQGRTSGCR